MTASGAGGVNGWARKREWKSRKYFESNRPHPNLGGHDGKRLD